jgi:lysosomal-associated membrane protein 1/2
MAKSTIFALALLSLFAVASSADPTTPEPQHTWFVNGTNGNICVLVQFRIHLTVPYNATNGNKTDLTSASFDLPQSAMVDKEGSSCNAGVTKMTQRVKLTFTVGKAHNVTVQFDQDKNGDTLVDQIAFDYDLSDAKVFPNATYTDSPIQHSVADRTFANIPKGNFYVCSTGAPATLVNGNVNITALFTDVEAQAFRNSSTTVFDGNGSVCPWDPSTSSVAPSTPTTPTPNIKYASYNVTSGADICLYVQFGISAALKYKNTSGSVVSALISDANSGRVDKARSFCNNETAFIVIGSSWISNWSFGLNFTRKGDRYSLTQVELDFALQNYTNVIVNANDTSAHVSHTNVDQWSAAVGHSYKCIDTATWSLNTTGFSDNIPELQLMLHDIQVQPFMTANATNFHFGDAEECPQDYTSDIVPIAVGCALAALVVIVLIAYVIGRRRNRARGYESM